MKKLLLTFISIFFLTYPFSLFSQAKIDINIKDLDDSLFYLVQYKSDKIISVIDTSNISENKKTFSNPQNYDEGIYVIADSKQQAVIELLIGKDQTFSIDIKDLMRTDNYKVKGSKETALYFEILAKSIHYNLHVEALQNEIKYNPENKRKIDSINKYLYDYQESMINKDEDLFLNTYIKCIEKINVPDSIKNIRSKRDAYIIEHYFDEIPLCDTRILNSRLLKKKLDDYFDNYIFTLSSDKICENIDRIITKTNDCKDVRDYILWYLYAKYFNPENVKHEIVYIHLANKYFSKSDIKNLSQDIRNEIIKRANIIQDIVIGAEAPQFSYYNENDSLISLADIADNNIILFFYKPDCQICKKDKKTLELLERRRNDITLLCVDISDEKKYKEIISMYDITTSPSIFLLDKNKKIITKRIKAEDVDFYLIKKY